MRAYASDGSARSPGEGGTVAFDRDLGYRLRGDDYSERLLHRRLFHVEGEGISRVQAN
ncbi:MAG: hypothetical protein ACLSDQ_11840 [Adlercreutzia equolifaciens]